MKRKNGYVLKYIKEIPYLLPFGQSITDHSRSIKLNETGVVLWNLLDSDKEYEDIIQDFFKYYEATEEYYEIMRNDANEFFDFLNNLGLIIDYDNSECTNLNSTFIKIAGLNIELKGTKDQFYHSNFEDFLVAPISNPDLAITFHNNLPSSTFICNSTVLIKSNEIDLYENDECYIATYKTTDGDFYINIHKSGKTADVYYEMPSSKNIKENIFCIIRFIFLYTATLHNIYAIHSASILYNKKIWIFSGPSGTGKSTHTDLWKKYYDISIINGDLNLLEMKNSVATVHGLPWCGTSNTFDTKSYPLGGIILLKQAPANELIPLTEDEKVLMVSQRFISPTWTKNLLEKAIDFSNDLINSILVCQLKCDISKEAVDTIKKEIDRAD